MCSHTELELWGEAGKLCVSVWVCVEGPEIISSKLFLWYWMLELFHRTRKTNMNTTYLGFWVKFCWSFLSFFSYRTFCRCFVSSLSKLLKYKLKYLTLFLWFNKSLMQKALCYSPQCCIHRGKELWESIKYCHFVFDTVTEVQLKYSNILFTGGPHYPSTQYCC